MVERAERTRVTAEMRRELRRDRAADALGQLVDVARRASAITPTLLGEVVDRIEDPGERRLWLGRLAVDALEAAHQLERLARMTEDVDGPIAFYEGHRHSLSRDGQAPTLTASGPPLVFVPPDPAA